MIWPYRVVSWLAAIATWDFLYTLRPPISQVVAITLITFITFKNDMQCGLIVWVVPGAVQIHFFNAWRFGVVLSMARLWGLHLRLKAILVSGVDWPSPCGSPDGL